MGRTGGGPLRGTTDVCAADDVRSVAELCGAEAYRPCDLAQRRETREPALHRGDLAHGLLERRLGQRA